MNAQQAHIHALLEEAAADFVAMNAVNVATMNALEEEGYLLENLEADIGRVLANS